MITVVKLISNSFDSLGRLLSKFQRMGKDDIQETLTVSPYGFESRAIKDMVAIHCQTGVSGESVIIGFINKDCLSEVGESRIFSTDENGLLKTFIHLKANGDIHFGGDAGNLTRYQELETGFNQLKSDFNTLITLFNSHVHSGVTTGPGASGPSPTPGTQTTASISGAKINEFKTL